MTKAPARRRRQPQSAWHLPGTALMWALPLFLPWLSLGDIGLDVPPRMYKALEAGTASIALVKINPYLSNT